jgi:conjugative transfer pilus assembly protein TraH
MKPYLRAFCWVALFMCWSWCQPAHAGWLDDWFSQHTSGGPGAFESDKRDFYTAGTFEGRWRLTNDSPVTFSMPRLKVGCGGIDGFLGGMSFMDAKYLVQKAEKILQAAPAFAFDLAMDQYCKECKAIKDFLEHATNLLNSIQENDCALSRRLGYAVTEDTLGGEHKDIMEQMWGTAAGGQSVGQGLQDNWNSFVNASASGTPPDDTKPLLSDCPDEFQQIFMSGSVVANVTAEVGLGGYDDIIRGLLGDVYVHQSADGMSYQADVISACPGNDNLDPTDFLTGEAEKKNTSNLCSTDSTNGAITIVAKHLNNIVTDIQTGTALSEDDQNFIDTSGSAPLEDALRDAVAAGTVTKTVNMLEGPLALEYAQHIFDDLYKAANLVLRKAKQVSDTQTAAKSDQRKCDTSFLSGAMSQISAMATDATKYRSMTHVAYEKMQQEMVADLARARQYHDARVTVVSKLASKIRSGGQ